MFTLLVLFGIISIMVQLVSAAVTALRLTINFQKIFEYITEVYIYTLCANSQNDYVNDELFFDCHTMFPLHNHGTCDKSNSLIWLKKFNKSNRLSHCKCYAVLCTLPRIIQFLTRLYLNIWTLSRIVSVVLEVLLH